MAVTAPVLALTPALSIQGAYGYRIEKDRVFINIDRINNDRGFDNLSGTIAVELRGYRQDGAETVLASTTIGQISGQYCLANCDYDLVFQTPEAGQWQLALELREWNGVAYALLERKYFDTPYVVAWQPTVVEPTAAPATKENVIRIEEAPSAPVAKTVKSKKTAKQEKAPKVDEESELISINKSSLEELSSVKGMPKKVAKEIVEKRPHTSWDALLKIKGMGPRMLKKLKKALKLD